MYAPTFLVHEAQRALSTHSQRKNDKNNSYNSWKNFNGDGENSCSLLMVQKHTKEKKFWHTCKNTKKLSNSSSFRNARQKQIQQNNAGNQHEHAWQTEYSHP